MRSEGEEPRRTGTATLLTTPASPPREDERIVRPDAIHHHLPPGYMEDQPLTLSPHASSFNDVRWYPVDCNFVVVDRRYTRGSESTTCFADRGRSFVTGNFACNLP